MFSSSIGGLTRFTLTFLTLMTTIVHLQNYLAVKHNNPTNSSSHLEIYILGYMQESAKYYSNNSSHNINCYTGYNVMATQHN